MLNLQGIETGIEGATLWNRYQNKVLLNYVGNLHSKIKKIGWPAHADVDSLVFLQTESFARECFASGFGIAIGEQKIVDLVSPEMPQHPQSLLFTTTNLKQSQMQILTDIQNDQGYLPAEEVPHWVSPEAKLGLNVTIGAYASVHRRATLSANVRIGDHVVIEEGAIIGEGTIIEAGVVIGHHCQIGKRCIIAANTVIGAAGFGYIPAAKPKKIPQIGIVVIEDEVEIGALCTIDRAAIGETRIGEATKMDNHCHIAHNCVIGKGCLMATGFWMAGSCSFGDHCYASGGVHILDHVHVGSNIMLGGRSGVSKDLKEPGSYTGYPIQKVQDSLKTTQNLTHLTSMRKRLFQLEKLVQQLTQDKKT